MARSRILFEKLIVTQLVNNLTTVPVLITEVCQRTVSCARKSGPPSSITLLLLHQDEKLWNSLKSLLQPSVSLRFRVTETCPGDQGVETCAPLSYYATSSGYFLPKFRDNLSVPSSGDLKMGPTGCAETSIRNYHYSLHNNPAERSSQLLGGGNLKSRSQGVFRPLWKSDYNHVCTRSYHCHWSSDKWIHFKPSSLRSVLILSSKLRRGFFIFSFFELNLFWSKFRPYRHHNFQHTMRLICGCEYRLWLSLWRSFRFSATQSKVLFTASCSAELVL
jgi:hypothetical protein